MLAAFVPVFAAAAFAQQTNPPANPPQAGAAPEATPPPQPSPAPQPAPAAKSSPADASQDDVDRFYSITATYWQMYSHPTLAGGYAWYYAEGSVLKYTGSNRDSLSGSLIVPLPSHADLNISYFRYSGSGSQYEPLVGAQYFTVVYAQGDYLVPSYTAQGGKATYEYLTLPWPYEKHKIRIYSLWSVAYFNMKTVIDAPFKTATVNSNTAGTNVANGGHMIILPMLGMKVEYPISKLVRLEASASGFGIPKHAAIWDADANASIHITRNFDIVVGARAFYFKTSPQATEYFSQLPSGAYGGIRYTLR